MGALLCAKLSAKMLPLFRPQGPRGPRGLQVIAVRLQRAPRPRDSLQ